MKNARGGLSGRRGRRLCYLLIISSINAKNNNKYAAILRYKEGKMLTSFQPYVRQKDYNR